MAVDYPKCQFDPADRQLINNLHMVTHLVMNPGTLLLLSVAGLRRLPWSDIVYMSSSVTLRSQEKGTKNSIPLFDLIVAIICPFHVP